MSDPFTRHGVKWLSPSSLNLFQSCPSFWVAKYLFGIKDEFGQKGARGTAIEAGLDVWLYGNRGDFATAHATALQNFSLNTGGQCDDEHEEQRALIGPMLLQATTELKDVPTPNARQLKIEHRFDDIEVPVIGYIDYIWDDWGLDLKTTERMPSKPKPEHARQVSIYSAAKGKPFKLLYVTDKKRAMYPVFETEIDSALKDMRRIALAMRTVLSRADSPAEVAGCYAPDYEAFYWNETTKKASEEIWK